MPRIRTIKPEFPQSESIGRLSREGRLLFVQLWTLCDDSGRTRAASRMLASLLYPYDEDAPSLIDGWLAELQRENCITLYRFDGTTYLEVVNWNKHQKIDKPTPSRLPAFSPELAIPLESSRIVETDLGPRTKDQEEEEKLSRPVPAEQDQPEKTDPPESPIIEAAFRFYCETLHRDPRRYTLTRERRQKAVLRFRERLKIHGSVDAAKQDIARAIRNLAASEYHVTNGYIDWTDQIFRSAEEFEKRLNWKAPQGGTNGKANTSKQGRAFDNGAEAARRIASRFGLDHDGRLQGSGTEPGDAGDLRGPVIDGTRPASGDGSDRDPWA